MKPVNRPHRRAIVHAAPFCQFPRILIGIDVSGGGLAAAQYQQVSSH